VGTTEHGAAARGEEQLPGPHLVVVDAYQGLLEYLTDRSEEEAAAAGLGLPLAELADALDARVTLLDWRDWRRYEERPDSFARWMPFPTTRPTAAAGPLPEDDPVASPRVTRRSIPAVDPVRGRPFEDGLSPQSYGLLANSDPLFLAAYVLNGHLEDIHRRDPIAAVLLPMWGGCGYVAQLSRATGVGLAGVRFAVVVTDTSARRQAANGEGQWTRPAITRRQMEDLSLALADLAVCFGPRGERTARAGRPVGAVIRAPRRVDGARLDAVARAAAAERPLLPPRFFIEAPQQPASGTLAMLDAANELRRRGAPIDAAVTCGGPDMRFAPLKPRSFQDYWSSRGWVRELVAEGRWAWRADARPGDDRCAVRVYPSLFEHLPDVWTELGRGGFPVLSPAAAEGLAPGETLPDAALLADEPTADLLADHLERLASLRPEAIERARRALCDAVLAAHRGPERQRLLDATTAALADLLAGRTETPSLAAAARLLLDRRVPATAAPPPAEPASPGPATLTVAVTCYEMGDLLPETVLSVWASHRLPDELIVVDDGSHGEATLAAIAALEAEASARRLPLTVLRQGNRGLAAARNAAIAAASGTYISFIDGDDLIDPAFYGLALDILVANPGLGGVAAWAITFGDDVPDGFWNAPQAELPLLLVENTLFVPIMMPVRLLRELGGYDTRQRYNYEDWEIGIRLLAAGWPVVTVPRYLQRYRVRGDSLLRTMSDVQNQVMRELLLANHRDTVARFAPEVAMQIEHELMKLRQAQAEAQAATPTIALDQVKPFARKARGAARLFGRLVKLPLRRGGR